MYVYIQWWFFILSFYVDDRVMAEILLFLVIADNL